MIGVVEYYEPPPHDYREAYLPGQICRAPIPFTLTERPTRLRLDYHDEATPQNSTFTLERTDLSTFSPADDPRLRFLNLTADNFLLSAACKFRHIAIISDPITDPSHNVAGYSGFIVAPLYTLHDPAGNYKRYITYEIVLRAQAYQLKNVFYLPASDEHGLKESFARLDRIQFVRSDHLFPKPVRLTEKATDLLRQWTWNFLGLSVVLDPALEQFIRAAAQDIDRKLAR